MTWPVSRQRGHIQRGDIYGEETIHTERERGLENTNTFRLVNCCGIYALFSKVLKGIRILASRELDLNYCIAT